MKKIVLFTLALAFAVSANAQNKWYVEGSVGATNVSMKDAGSLTTIKIMPSIHYMFNENWAVGLGLGWDYTKDVDKSETPNITDKTNEFSVAPSLTYFMKLGDKFYYTPELVVSYTRGKESKVNTIGAAIAPLSFEFRPTDCIGINFAAGTLGFASEKGKVGNALNTLNFDLNSGATVAFRFYF